LPPPPPPHITCDRERPDWRSMWASSPWQWPSGIPSRFSRSFPFKNRTLSDTYKREIEMMSSILRSWAGLWTIVHYFISICNCDTTRLKTTGSFNLQCCGSGMFIPDPDFYAFRIPDPDLASWIQQQQQKRGKNLLSYLFWSLKFSKIVNYLIFEEVKKKI
jgi:hypothetical protein